MTFISPKDCWHNRIAYIDVEELHPEHPNADEYRWPVWCRDCGMHLRSPIPYSELAG